MSLIQTVKTYHEETKHHLHRYAASLGYLDWNSQPDPFRRFIGSRLIELPFIKDELLPTYSEIFTPGKIIPSELNVDSLAQFLEYSLAISAWKQLGVSKWALRVNPSSGNLHPTEGYVILPALKNLSSSPGVYHYAVKEHGLENRAEFPVSIWEFLPEHVFLLGLTSIYWREAWKYGERAFRYCQHDCGHAYMALDIAAKTLGWQMNLVSSIGDEKLARLLGLNRQDDFRENEEEYPELLALVNTKPQEKKIIVESMDQFIDGVEAGTWHGKANRLSNYHQPWEVIQTVHRASVKPALQYLELKTKVKNVQVAEYDHTFYIGQLVKKRRSAVDMDAQISISKKQFYQMLERVKEGFEGVFWNPKIHLCLFIHRVNGLAPGLYMLMRNPDIVENFSQCVSREFLWQRPSDAPENLHFYLLKEGNFIEISKSLSCGQDIAGDGVFSLAMMAEFDQPLEEYGAWFYKRLFWEAGMIGQLLYLEAEAIGISATGIGCFFDDPVHELLGFKDSTFQDLYHFTVGGAVIDDRLTTLPAYERNR